MPVAEASVTSEILGQQNGAEPVVQIRTVTAQPQNLGGGERGADRVASPGRERVAESLPELGAFLDRALVVPENCRADGRIPWPQDDRAVHLAGQPDRIGRCDAIQQRPAGDQQGLPPDVGVLLRPSRHGRVQWIWLPCRPDDPPGLIDQHRLTLGIDGLGSSTQRVV